MKNKTINGYELAARLLEFLSYKSKYNNVSMTVNGMGDLKIFAQETELAKETGYNRGRFYVIIEQQEDYSRVFYEEYCGDLEMFFDFAKDEE